MAAHIVAYEGRVCNLSRFESYHIEEHPGVEGQFYVKASWIRHAGSMGYGENLYQGTEDECKKYFRDTIAPKLDLDTSSEAFKKFYGTSRAKKAPAAE